MTPCWRAALQLVATFALATPILAQPAVANPPRFAGGLRLALIAPVGDFGDGVDFGIGAEAHAVFHLVPSGLFSVRADLGILNYGTATDEICLAQPVGCRFDIDLTTTNNIAHGYLGPQVALPLGPVRPYLNAGAGFSYFFTETAVEGGFDDGTDDVDEDDDGSGDFDDFGFGWVAGGGIAVPLRIRGTTLSVDLGARFHFNDDVEYLIEDDVRPELPGGFDFDPRRGDANFLGFLLGVSLGLGRW
jgi:hypothetical protein